MTQTTEALSGFPDKDANLAALIARQVRDRPDAVALIADREWTYQELHARQMAFAQGLAQLGLSPETTVAVILPRDGDMVALLLAILWCGLAYVPIDPEDPSARGCRIQRAADCHLILGSAKHLAQLRQAEGETSLPRMIIPDDLIDMGRAQPVPDCAPGGDRLAYVLFTSGSTGEPKGVEIEHRQLVNLLLASKDLLHFGKADRYLAVATIAFDISVVELFLPLMVGGSLLLRDRALLRDPVALFADLKRHAVTVVQLGPSSWSVLLNAEWAGLRLRVAISTGEPITPLLAAQLPGVADLAFNLYGPTETTVWATGYKLLPPDGIGLPQASRISAPIGVPLAGCSAIVADADGRPVKDGDEGELLIGGAGLARGYRARPDLTAERFVQFGPTASRYYRTGDVVRRDAKGDLHYFGRNDDQVKVRGIRIEPREVEDAVLSVPEVEQVAATWFDTGSGSRGIMVAVIWRPGQSMPFERLHRLLGKRLPKAMVPSRFLALDRLPLTASGKVDRTALRMTPPSASETRRPVYAGALSLSDTEARLTMIWQKTLRLDRVDLDTHFFTEGGDSLSAIAMCMDVEKVFDVSVDPNSIWDAPRLVDFAKLVERSRAQPDDIKNTRIVFPLVKDGTGSPLFFSNVNLKLARSGLWTAGCPLYAMVQWAYGQGFVRTGSIRELAAALIVEIRAIQGAGPYRIGGYSLGGLIALEIAQQLRARGDEVGLLFLLDPMAPVQYRGADPDQVLKAPGFVRAPLWRRIAEQLRATARNPRSEAPRALRRLAQAPRRWSVWQWLEYHLVDLHGRHPSAMTRMLLPRRRWPAFWYVARRLARSYVAERYEGRCLAVFHDQAERYATWRSLLTGEVEVAVIESSHLGMFVSPQIDEWTGLLGKRLQQAGSDSGQSVGWRPPSA